MNFLSELREFVGALRDVFTAAPADALVVVIVGSLLLGAFGGWYLHKVLRRKPPSTGPGLPKPDAPQPDPVCANARRLLTALDGEDDALWRFHPSDVPRDLLKRIYGKLRVVTFTNLKGGVGKTTLTANLAAYFHQQGKRVLLIDFDYQGSLSATVLKAADRRDTISSEADKILSGALAGADVVNPMRRLAPRLGRMTLIPAEYELNRQENRLLMRWLLDPSSDDPRYALVRLLASDEVLEKFDLVLIDTPPRLGLATLCGLCASTDLIVPAIFNPLSIGNVGGLLEQLDRLFVRDLNPGLKVAGIVGVMTNNQVALTRDERQARLDAEEAAQAVLGARAGGIQRVRQLSALGDWPVDGYVLRPWMPDTVRFPRRGEIAYLEPSADYQTERDVIDALGAELARRIGL